MKKCTFFSDFKDFISKGNVVDMAIGVIMGAAFGKIITSLVNDIIMPPIGWLIGGVDFSKLAYTMPVNPLNKTGEAVTINYGNFIQVCINFIIIAFCVFLMIKAIMKLSRKRAAAKAEAPAEPPKPSQQEVLLAEIRDLLKK